MWQWHIAYEGDEQPVVREIASHYGEYRNLFRRAKIPGRKFEIAGRPVVAMWIIELDTEQADVVLTFGRVPHEIRVRHLAYKAERKAPPERG